MPVHLWLGPHPPLLPSLGGGCGQSNAAGETLLPLLAGRAGLEAAGAPTPSPHEKPRGRARAIAAPLPHQAVTLGSRGLSGQLRPISEIEEASLHWCFAAPWHSPSPTRSMGSPQPTATIEPKASIAKQDRC